MLECGTGYHIGLLEATLPTRTNIAVTLGTHSSIADSLHSHSVRPPPLAAIRAPVSERELSKELPLRLSSRSSSSPFDNHG